ncbi:hypothetical protein L1987_64538 [Smallanthus sonchifolius]|uniref:Uncharacterized protein n=1 Tax=Smallanthus sonchifolius TaxID=185202 RepID=A0ACB9BS04_9ASTR|nr:hypothetical protein L1987_64538 [Smallanthus sonchifolius]
MNLIYIDKTEDNLESTSGGGLHLSDQTTYKEMVRQLNWFSSYAYEIVINMVVGGEVVTLKNIEESSSLVIAEMPINTLMTGGYATVALISPIIFGWKGANGTEFDEHAPNPIVIFTPEGSRTHMGNTMRLGSRRILLQASDCITAKLYEIMILTSHASGSVLNDSETRNDNCKQLRDYTGIVLVDDYFSQNSQIMILGWKGANGTELDEHAPNPVVIFMPEYQNPEYVDERHRHRHEENEEQLEVYLHFKEAKRLGQCANTSSYGAVLHVHTFQKACVAVYPRTVQNGIVWLWPCTDPQYKVILTKNKPPYIPELAYLEFWSGDICQMVWARSVRRLRFLPWWPFFTQTSLSQIQRPPASNNPPSHD